MLLLVREGFVLKKLLLTELLLIIEPTAGVDAAMGLHESDEWAME